MHCTVGQASKPLKACFHKRHQVEFNETDLFLPDQIAIGIIKVSVFSKCWYCTILKTLLLCFFSVLVYDSNAHTHC